MQEHQCQQSSGLRLVRHEVREQASQADGFVGKVPADQAVAGGGRVALVEDQVEHGQHRVQPLRQQVRRRDAVGNAGVADLAFGAYQSLRQGRLRKQEGAGDLRCGEAAERSQREGHARLGRKRRVATGEDQPQPVVVDAGAPVVAGRPGPAQRRTRLGAQFRQLAKDGLALGQATNPAQPVDGLVARRGDDPARGVGGNAGIRPLGDRHQESLLDGLFREIEVAEDANEPGNGTALLLTEDALDGLEGRGTLAQPASG